MNKKNIDALRKRADWLKSRIADTEQNSFDKNELLAIKAALHDHETQPTKRELFAAMAMVGLLAAGEHTTQNAVDLAEDLIEALSEREDA